MERRILNKVRGFQTEDGAGVKLVRVLGFDTVKEYDPILMLDSFDSKNPKDYIAGFPMHPHRGIETISYIYQGKITHRDSLGNEDTISNGEVQWMTAGSGILHEEMLPASETLLGVQLWLNLPAISKMTEPAYHSIKNQEIQEIEFEGGKLRLLAGEYKSIKGYMSKYLPLDYYDIHLEEGNKFEIDTKAESSVLMFTLSGDVKIAGEIIKEKTAVKLSKGDLIVIEAIQNKAQILFVGSNEIKEPVEWGGPIVMNTKEELNQAFEDLRKGTFLQKEIKY